MIVTTVRAAIAKVIGPKVLFALALAGVAMTWLMLLIGGTVNPNEAGMACSADWHNMLVPKCDDLPMTGGALYEHGHRLWGYAIGWLTFAIALGAWASPDLAKKTKHLAFASLSYVVVQALLGLLTVALGFAHAKAGEAPRTNPYMSTAHLVVGYGFLSLMVVLAWRLAPSRRADPSWGESLPRRFVMIAAGLALVQSVVGGAMRHFGAGMICGDDPIGCAGRGIIPSTGLEALHMTHRGLGYLIAVVVVFVTLRALRTASAAQRPKVAMLALAPLLFVVAQVSLGLLTVMAGKIVVVVALHTAIGGLLVASLVAVYLGLGPLGARRAAVAHAPIESASNAKGALA